MSDLPDPKLDPIKRVVTRKGKVVTIVQHIGTYTAPPIVYELPSYAKAKEFEAHANTIEGKYPVTLSMKWRDYLMEEVPEVDETPGDSHG